MGRRWTDFHRIQHDEQVETLTRLFRQCEPDFGADFFTQATFEFAGHASLSWYLTDVERRIIQNEATRLGDVTESPPCRTMSNLAKWWRGHW